MAFYRKAEIQLDEWKRSPYRKPLVLRGARQTGKTTLIKKFSENFDTFIYLNLEKDADRALFENTLEVKDLIQYICLEKNLMIVGETLLFIDEIQYSKRAVMLMRYFYEEMPDLFVISAGSLLEIMMEKQKISFPVGRVSYLYLFPMCFEEFLEALGETQALSYYRMTPVPDIAHHKLSALFRLYTFIGGMPEAVDRYEKTRDLSQLMPVYAELINAFKDDVSKYASDPHESDVIRHIIETAPAENGNRITFEKFGNSGYKSLDIKNAMRKLERAMLLYLRYPVTGVTLPALPNQKMKPRLHILDAGLLNHAVGIGSTYFSETALDSVYKGLLAEQIVWQELLSAHNIELKNPLFWVREKKQSNSEVDFLINHNGTYYPVEVKSGKTGTLRSLHQFILRSDQTFAVRLYDNVFSMEEVVVPQQPDMPEKSFKLLNLPLYCAGKLEDYIAYYNKK